MTVRAADPVRGHAVIPFTLMSGLMVFDVKEPSDKELCALPWHTLTSPKVWVPRNFCEGRHAGILIAESWIKAALARKVDLLPSPCTGTTVGRDNSVETIDNDSLDTHDGVEESGRMHMTGELIYAEHNVCNDADDPSMTSFSHDVMTPVDDHVHTTKVGIGFVGILLLLIVVLTNSIGTLYLSHGMYQHPNNKGCSAMVLNTNMGGWIEGRIKLLSHVSAKQLFTNSGVDQNIVEESLLTSKTLGEQKNKASYLLHQRGAQRSE